MQARLRPLTCADSFPDCNSTQRCSERYASRQEPHQCERNSPMVMWLCVPASTMAFGSYRMRVDSSCALTRSSTSPGNSTQRCSSRHASRQETHQGEENSPSRAHRPPFASPFTTTSIGTGYDLSASTYSPDRCIFHFLSRE